MAPWDSELLLSGLLQGNINTVLTGKLFQSLILCLVNSSSGQVIFQITQVFLGTWFSGR